MANADLTAQRLRELLDYDKETGVFTRKITSGRWVAGQAAGGLTTHGYIGINIDKRVHLAHRLVWLHVYGAWPKNLIDHKNGTKTDNRFDNLRDATYSENGQNQLVPGPTNKSGFLGVSVHHKKWAATIKMNGKKIHLGSRETPEECSELYLQAKRELHPFGCL